MKLFELQRERARKADDARKVVQKAIDEKRDLTDAEKADVEARKAEIAEVSRKIELVELRDQFESATPEERRDGGRLGPELPDLDGPRHKYSVIRALRLSLESRGAYDGLEGEVHAELQRHRGAAANGILVPLTLANRSLAGPAAAERRDLTTSTAAGGIANVLGTELIDILRNKMVMRNLGARVLSGLTGGTFSLPKQTGKATAYHTAEAASAAASNLTLGQVTWTPRTLTGITALTRKTLLQTSLDIEALAREDLMAVLALEFDRVGINGEGANNVPLGILQDPNVPTVPLNTNGDDPTWDMVVGLETQVAQANAEFGSLAYLTSNKGRGKMKRTLKVSGSNFPVYLWEKGLAYGEGEVNSYRAVSTEQVPSNLSKGTSNGVLTALIYGNFNSPTYGLWSGVDVLADPYTRGAAGSLLIYMYQDYDFQFRYEQSFAKCVDMKTA